MAVTQVLFSPVAGTVTRGGLPVTGASLVRTFYWHWGNEKGSDSTVTDSNGNYTFPAIIRRSWSASFLFHDPTIDQRITIEVDGQIYEGWALLKSNYDMNGELRDRDIRLSCDISQPADRKETHYGLCDLK